MSIRCLARNGRHLMIGFSAGIETEGYNAALDEMDRWATVGCTIVEIS